MFKTLALQLTPFVVALIAASSHAQDVTQKVIVQNELGKAATHITVRLSTASLPRPEQGDQIIEQPAFDIPANGPQEEIDLNGDGKRYRWVQLSYQVDGDRTVFQTAGFSVSRRPGTNRGRYIDQAILRIRTEDGSSSQCQIDEKPNPQGLEAEPETVDFPKRTYLHEYGALRLNGSDPNRTDNNGSCYLLDPDNDVGPAFFSNLRMRTGQPILAKVKRAGQDEDIEGWVYHANSNDVPAQYRFIFLARNPSDPNNVVSSYVGYSPTFNRNEPRNTTFQQYRNNFTAHENAN